MSNRVVLFLFYKYIINIMSRIKKNKLMFYTYISMVLSLMKSQWSGFSTSTTPHGYIRPLTFLPLTSITVLAPITAKGTASCKSHSNTLILSFSSHNKANSSINWGHCHTLLRTIKRPWQLNWPWGGDIALCNPRPHPRHSRAARTGWCRSQLSGSSPAQVTKVHDQWLITCVVLIKHFTYMNVFNLKLTYISYYFIVIWLCASQDCNAVTFQGL